MASQLEDILDEIQQAVRFGVGGGSIANQRFAGAKARLESLVSDIQRLLDLGAKLFPTVGATELGEMWLVAQAIVSAQFTQHENFRNSDLQRNANSTDENKYHWATLIETLTDVHYPFFDSKPAALAWLQNNGFFYVTDVVKMTIPPRSEFWFMDDSDAKETPLERAVVLFVRDRWSWAGLTLIYKKGKRVCNTIIAGRYASRLRTRIV